MNYQSNPYLRIANELRKTNPTIENILIETKTPQEDQFNNFILNHLSKFLQAHQCLQKIKQSLGSIVKSKHCLTSLYSKLPQTIKDITDDTQLQQIFAEVIQMDRALKKAREFEQVNKQAEFHLKQLKYLKFQPYDDRLNLKVKKLVDVVNVYQSFLVCMAAERKDGKLESSAVVALKFYKENYQFTNDPQAKLMRKIEAQINEFDQMLLTVEKLTVQFPSHTIRQNCTISQQLQNIYKSAVETNKQMANINSYLQQAIDSLKQNKQIPSVSNFIHSINTKTLNLLGQLKSLIPSRPLLIKYSTPWFNPLNIFNLSSLQEVSYEELKGFVCSIYSKLQNAEDQVTIKQKMKSISERIQKGPNSQIIEEVFHMQPTLNQVIDKILNCHRINKQQSHKPQIIYSFSLEDIRTLNRAIEESLRPNFIEERPFSNISVSTQPSQKHLTQAIEQITKLFERLLKNSKKGEVVFSAGLSQRVKQFEQLISEVLERPTQSNLLRQFEANNARIFDQYQLLTQKNEPQKQCIPVLQKSEISAIEKSIDYQRELVLNKSSLQGKQALIKQLQSQLAQIRAKYDESNAKQLAIKYQFQSKCKEIEHLKDLSKQQAMNQTLEIIKQQIYSLQHLNVTLKQENQIYLESKISLLNEFQAEKRKHQKELRDLRATHEIQIRNAKQLQSDKSKRILSQLSQKCQAENKKLLAQIQYLSRQYSELKEKHYCQIQEKLNQSILNVSRMLSRGQVEAQASTSYIQQSQDIKQNDDLDQILRLQQQNIKKYQDQSKELNTKICNLKSELDSCKAYNQTLQQQKSTKEQQNEKLKQQVSRLQEKNSNLQRQLNVQLQNIHTLKKTIKQLESNIKTISEESAKARESQRETRESVQQRQIQTNLSTMVHYTRCLFTQDIFYNSQEQKQKLVSHLQWYVGSKITRTQLLHKYDTRNKTNFHQYIDQVQGLAIVVKTNCAIIAGFYPGALRDKEVLNKGGLLVSVTNDQSYVLYNKKPGDNSKTIFRGMIYDTFFAIFGNAEIRVKTGFKTVFSNFGVSNGYYNSRGDKIDKFLNEGDKREVQFEFCEFYKISFQRSLSNHR